MGGAATAVPPLDVGEVTSMANVLSMLYSHGPRYVMHYCRGRQWAQEYRRTHSRMDRYHTAQEAAQSLRQRTLAVDPFEGFDEGWLSVDHPDDFIAASLIPEVTSNASETEDDED